MDEGMDELLAEFLVESFENLDQLDQDLITLEQSPDDLGVLQSIFRTIHTIKGTCGFLGFSKLERISHVGESLLSLLRDGVATVDQEIASALLAMTTAVRAILVAIENTTGEGDFEYLDLVGELTRLEERARNADVGAEDLSDVETPDGARVGELLVLGGAASEVDVAIGLIQQQDGGDERRIGEILTEASATSADKVAEAVALQGDAKSAVADSTIRVDVGLLDELMTLVGELVLARNQILQLAGDTQGDPVFVQTTQRLNVITTELQVGVMKTRMQPVGNVWNKFPRVVRDLATQCGKQVRIEMDGKDTELDKTIIEAIKDPLTHLIRNSIDHGIEMPDVRKACGKPENGTVFLRAYHEGGQVNIEISDDGAGIDVARVKSLALGRGLITTEQADKMSDREVVNLIFLAGFSTAEQVSKISGRGVGMDVVRTNIERIGGQIELQNRPRAGTTVKVKIPLTLAIIPALVVTCGGEKFAIPQVSLLELVGLDGDARRNSIENVHGVPVYRLRGNILPIVNLHEQLSIEASTDRHSVTIVVLRADDHEFGLIVDEVNDTEEIVVKPLATQLKNMNSYSGCTIMGDGKVALILDVTGIAQRSRVLSATGEHSNSTNDTESVDAVIEKESLLVLQVGSNGRAALPLAVVDRLEEFQRSSIEHAAGREVVQYRGSIMPLVDVCGALGYSSVYESESDQVQVVVFSHGGRMVGLVVERIIDIVQETFASETVDSRFGMIGNTVLQGLVTDLVDVHEVIRSMIPEFFTTQTDSIETGRYSHV